MTVTAYPLLTPTSGGTVKVPSGNVYAVNPAANVTRNGAVMATTTGTSLLSWTPTPNLIYRKSASTGAWTSWDGVSWKLLTTPPPVLPGKAMARLSAPTTTTLTVTITAPTDGNTVGGYHVRWRKHGSTGAWVVAK
jgi:hypothetical protein